MYKKIISLIIIFSFVFSNNIFAGSFSQGKCSIDLIMTQNLKAPKAGEKYVKNGKYHWYTKTTVREAHILQKHLNRLGFNAGKVDGIIGPNTKGAILRMQKFLGTKQDGYVGPKTRKLLNESCGDNLSQKVNYSGDFKIMYGEKSVKDFIIKTKKGDKSYDNNFSSGMVADTVMSKSLSASEQSTESVNLAPRDFSKTNTQVDGVDESDITKTDGKYIYTISKSKKLFIFNASNPKDMKMVSKITADKNESMREMYINGKELILISNYWENNSSTNSMKKSIAIYPYLRNKSFTRVEIYNITNPENPIKIKKIDFEGNLKESRITNNHLYFVTSKGVYDNFPIMPMIRVDNKISTDMFGNDFYYVDSPLRNYNLTSISVLNLKNLADFSSKRVLMPNSGNIYVSQNNFYLTYNKYQSHVYMSKIVKAEMALKTSFHFLPSSIHDSLKEIEKEFLKTSVINRENEKKIKGFFEKEFNLKNNKENLLKVTEYYNNLILEDWLKNKPEGDVTKIEKFSFEGTEIKVVASGKVSGFALNQFSIHENSSKELFVATTVNPLRPPYSIRKLLPNQNTTTVNNLYSLDENLKNLDSIENLAKGERIKSVRFVKDHAYLVTFRQTDPLFNIDISNPKKLRLLGELKIDGFSQYLHPVFDDRLIGLGREVYVDKYGNQRNGGIKITLFDISRDKPKEIKSIILGGNGSYSEALNNHKAILISENKKIMAFPVSLYKKSASENDYNRDFETGVILLNIEQNDISKISLLESGNGWEQKAKRAIRIGDVIYSVSIEKSKSFNLKNGEELGKIFFEDEKEITTY